MKVRRDRNEINKRCELLESLGFTIIHEDSRVCLQDLEFDFSATNMNVKNIIYQAIMEAYSQGEHDGRKEIQEKLMNLIGIENEQR